jgi:peptide/nickel transport system permease protein
MAEGKKAAVDPVADGSIPQVQPPYSETRRVLRVFVGRKLAVIGLVLVLLFILTAIFAHWLAPYDPYKVNIVEKLQQPSMTHLLGTDSVGRDTLSRVIYSSQTSIMVCLGAVGLAVLVGESLGLMAAYFGGWVYIVIMRLTDALMASPMILNAIILSSLLGGGIKNVIIALGIGMVSSQCRLMCGQALTLKNNEYIMAGRAMGASDLRMMLIHILPNAFPPIIVMITIQLGTAILAEAGLSFLGIGIEPPQAAWGGMVSEGYKYLMTSPLLSFAPGVAIMMAVFGFNMMGDGLRDALDPRLRGIL